MKRLNTQGFIEKLNKETNGEFELLSEYKNNLTPILVKHKICGNVFELKTPYNIFKYTKNSCPICSNKYKRTTKMFAEEIKDILGDEYEIVGEYKSTNKPIKIKHIPCGRIFSAIPREIKSRGLRCTFCYGYMKNVDTKIFSEKVKQVYGDMFEVLGEYINARTKVKLKCNNCGNIFYVTPDNLLHHDLIGCPKCSKSRGEKKIAQFLDKHNIKYKQEYIFNDCVDKYYLRFDFAVFDNDKLLFIIEYDGIQHFRPTNFNSKMSRNDVETQFKDTTRKDKIKTQYCLTNNIKLLRIKYTDYNKINDILTKYINDNTVLSLK